MGTLNLTELVTVIFTIGYAISLGKKYKYIYVVSLGWADSPYIDLPTACLEDIVLAVVILEAKLGRKLGAYYSVL